MNPQPSVPKPGGSGTSRIGVSSALAVFLQWQMLTLCSRRHRAWDPTRRRTRTCGIRALPSPRTRVARPSDRQSLAGAPRPNNPMSARPKPVLSGGLSVDTGSAPASSGSGAGFGAGSDASRSKALSVAPPPPPPPSNSAPPGSLCAVCRKPVARGGVQTPTGPLRLRESTRNHS